ncbi:MAG TPA: PilZ domain-containing protein [Gemmatimonadales bacterium]|nr:PilZ domain-containing protein [Gemmatimonadales bacterium]
MKNETRAESREFSRARVPVTAEVVAGERTVRTERVRDVSMSGVYLELPGLAPAGAACEVSIQLNPPEGPVVRARGRVARVDAAGIGVAFEELLGLESLEHLRNLILYHGTDPDRLVTEFLAHDGLQRRR